MSKVPARNDGPEPSGSGLYSQLQSVSRRTLEYVQDIARSLVLATLSSCESGTLHIHEPSRSEKTTTVGSIGQNDSLASLTIHDDFFWVRILLSGDIGFAQSYMLHEISSPDLTALFAFFIRNGSSMSSATTYGTAWVLDRAIRSVAGATNNIATAKLNANSHYSLSNDMFAAFLSPDMTYSAPLWLPASDPGAARDTLEEAQMRKLQYAIDQTHIKATDHVLEVGTGWGSFSILAARTTGCRVTTITPSREQKKLAEERIAEAGLSDRIEVLLADYRELRPERPFDKIVSIEMIEHVGHRYLDTYFACMDRYLKRDGGIAYFQCITIPEARYAEYLKGQDFIKKYIFPGGHLPTNSGLVGSIDRASRGKLVVDEIKSFGGHYSKALRCWNEKFQANFESEIAPGLRKSFPEMTRAALDIFRRKWEYYFCYCEAGFSSKILGDVGITVAREGAVELLEGLP